MRRILLFLSALLLMTSGCSSALAWSPVDLAVVDRDSGRTIPQHPHLRERWIAGQPGQRYALRLTNNTGERVLVVLSVDGINAVTGQTANPSQGGYVLDPWETTEITGWRKSLEEVAQFVFTDPGSSYAARTGRPSNVGVIGIAVFRDRHPSPPVYHEDDDYSRRERGNASADAAAAPQAAKSAAGEARAQTLGTGHGQREWSQVNTTEFERATAAPVQVTELRYDTPRRLIALGILPRRSTAYDDAPRAFPQGFVPDPPPRWR